jgi:tryptophanyl-tRNA synthetase
VGSSNYYYYYYLRLTDSKTTIKQKHRPSQDPYFRITRGIAHKIVPPTHPLKGKPSLIHSKFFPPLEGAEGKMSSSNDNSAIFLTDTPEQIQEKITEHAFSGGQMTKKLQEEKGADLDVDVAFQWLCFFMEDDDELERIRESYGSGKGEYWSTALVKNRLIKLLKELVAEHQRKRALVTDEEVREWMSVRSLKC